jgi:PRTRC genetic system protein E
MFTEMMPLLKQRVLMLTISLVDDESILVNVIPKKRESAADENTALTLPLSLRGKPDELDRDLPSQLAAFAETVIQTGSNLEDLRAQHTAAIKAVEAENRKRLDEKRRSGAKTGPAAEKSNGAAESRDFKPVFGSKTQSGSVVPASLFDHVEPDPEVTATSPLTTQPEV